MNINELIEKHINGTATCSLREHGVKHFAIELLEMVKKEEENDVMHSNVTAAIYKALEELRK